VSKQEFRALVIDYGAQVLSTAMRILGNSEKAQDVHQEVFVPSFPYSEKYFLMHILGFFAITQNPHRGAQHLCTIIVY
jgi:ABC-type Zn2+ transport system substrate-binding protein/surface adhesin